MENKKRKLGYLCTIVTCFIWGSIYVASKIALQAISPVEVLFFRYLVGIISLSVLLIGKKSKKKVEKGDWKYICLVGGSGYFLSITFQMIGTKLLDASLASLINSLCPIVISVLAAIFLKERIQLKHALGIVISLVGIYVILGVGGASINLWGVITSLCAVFFWSSASVAIRKISGRYDPVQISLYGIVIAFFFTILVKLAETRGQLPAITVEAAIACIYLGVVGTAVAHTLWNYSLSLLNASVCSMFYPIQPLTSALLGVLLFHEVITRSFIVGGILICLGVIVSVMERKK